MSDLKEILGLTDTDMEIIKTLQIKKGEYSELFYVQGNVKQVLRVTPPPLLYWIATTSADDKALIRQYEIEFPELSYIEVLEKIIEDQKGNKS